jgi:hypothetical protein
MAMCCCVSEAMNARYHLQRLGNRLAAAPRGSVPLPAPPVSSLEPFGPRSTREGNRMGAFLYRRARRRDTRRPADVPHVGSHVGQVEDLPAVQALCHDQRQRFLADASAIHVELERADADV